MTWLVLRLRYLVQTEMDATQECNKNNLRFEIRGYDNERHPGVFMQGRRSHKRMAIANFEGVLSVLHDVVVSTTETGELLAMDREPHQIGELATLERMVGDVIVSTKVQVIACRPIVDNGDLLHQIRLAPVAADVVTDKN